MNNLLETLAAKGVKLSASLIDVLSGCKKVTVFNSIEELAAASTCGLENDLFEVKYDIPGKGLYTEAVVNRVTNGISVNYTEAYMRRRDPNTMVIADDKPTDKVRFKDKYGYDFSVLRKETEDWLKEQELAVFFYFAGSHDLGAGGMAVCPANAAFFAMGLGMLQQLIPIEKVDASFSFDSVIYVAPPFRHTHFEGKQVVVHNRTEDLHELFSFNLYPGPSAKKGLYSVLLDKGEKESWITNHCSTVQAISPYDNVTIFMHEGASGGGKSEMHQHILREPDGQILIGENLITGEKRRITIPMFCEFRPVTDDMAICHPSLDKGNGKLTLIDAENAWFIRVDSIKEYGDDPFLEKLTIKPKSPLLFFNVETKPGCTALVWDHIEDEPGKRCPNPRVVVPRELVPNTVDKPVSIDVRSFGVRTPPCTAEAPSYGIIGMFHILPPALAWIWRLVAPRGFANPSISSASTTAMEAEGVGSYWPFATGTMVHHANMLLDQIVKTPNVEYTLAPNQHIGAWKVGFKPQLFMREYLTRRGNVSLRSDQYQPARCSLLGYELNYLTIEGSKIPSRFLKVYKQPEIGFEGYDEGSQILQEFFARELKRYLTPELAPLGRRIIEAFLAGASVDDYNALLPMINNNPITQP
ncbi:DUF4914 family protein [Acetobacteroides hydrogenigenes]|uniref:Uncharacterized protein DUF4914 n=1 Tax=Acetobacteroides hydrogenigenes TaxID=979970 RepID=A0A4R2ENT8_9BACT|nr:DUF4914 family protein [Acetobacteroides hydrogenigenes]TCN70513.1 uncharacterized protein DUF4914 [Acetobacteroides hydrogenigenes]